MSRIMGFILTDNAMPIDIGQASAANAVGIPAAVLATAAAPPTAKSCPHRES